MSVIKYLAKRLAVFIPLFLGVIFVTFILIRMLPGDPAQTLAGSLAYEDTVQSLRENMGLDKPVHEQFFIYVKNTLKGDFGRSWFTSTNVKDDILKRFPATFELITLSIILAIIIGITLAILSARRPKGIFSKISNIYGLLAGSFADFWLALMLVFFFFTVLGWAPSPMGRIDLMFSAPPRVTGMYLLDSALAGDWQCFKNAASHLALPVITLGFVQGALVLKMTYSTMTEVLEMDFIDHCRLLGISERKIMGYAFKNSAPNILTVIGNIYTYLLGGAVLIETVFSWGGLGQYVTTALSNRDYAPIQSFVLVATVFSMLVYLIIDLIQMAIDPRIKY